MLDSIQNSSLQIFTKLLAVFALILTPGITDASPTILVPNTVSGGTGTITQIQADDGIAYSAARGNTITIGGFTAVGGDISSVVLHVKFSVDSGGYSGTSPIQVNGINSSIIPADGDTQRTSSVNITSGAFRVNTWPEITTLAVSFNNNDGDPSQAVRFDHIYLVVTHTAPLFAPPTWSDEFDDGGPPNPATWTFEQGFVRNSELQWYQANNAWQQNGNLIIEGRREQVANPNYLAGSSDWRRNRQFAQYTSSSITSRAKFSFKYGRMQVRAKIPCFPGTWPAIWTLGNSGEWPSNGECDVLEYYATDSVLANIAKGTNTRWSAAWDAVKKPVSPTFTKGSPSWRTEYHIWTMQWDEQNIRLYLDNHFMNITAQSWMVNPVTTWGPKEPFKQPHFLLLNLALGGAGGDPSRTAFPLRYEVDYVRVWEGLTSNQPPTNIALSSNTVPEGVPSGTVVGNLTATDVDAAEVHSFSLVSGTGSTHNAQFEVIFQSDQTKTSVLRTKATLNSVDGATRSIRVRATDIEGATFDKVMTVQLAGQFVIETSPSTLTIPEGTSSTFNVRLRVAPTVPTTVNVSRQSGDSDLQVTSGSSLDFTPLNGTVWQTVTVGAANDADRANGSAVLLCEDPSGTFSNATVLVDEADSNPMLAATVALSNLNQTFNGEARTITVTTTPPGLDHVLTYDGQFMPPADAGTYVVEAVIDDPDHVGSASASLQVAKAGQTITFASIDSVLDDAPPFPLAATATSELVVSYANSNPAVAMISGNLVTLVGPGTTNITASQSGDDNYLAATPVMRTLTVLRANPLALTTGPYLVVSNQSLSLSAIGSQPSDSATISTYSWDLNNDGNFGDITGITPAPITYASLINTWSMVDGLNTIALRVTDSAGKVSTITTTVEVVVSLTWDSNGSSSALTDGPGDWTAASQWWNGTSHSTWASGDDAIFGNGGTGGEVTLEGPTTINSLTFNAFTGTYTLGTSDQPVTLSTGIIKNASGTGTAAIISPVTLGAAQSWTNDSTGLLSIGPNPVSNEGHLLSVNGTGSITVTAAISGTGGLTKSGTGTLNLSGPSAYAGTTTINGGNLVLSSANTISAATNVTSTGTLQLRNAASMGTSILTLASGANLQLRNDASTIFTAPIATPSTAVTYRFDVNNAGGSVTGNTLSLGNITFATSTSTATNQINVTGGNNYTLGLGTISAPSGGPGGPHPLIINPTTAAVIISRVSSGSFGTALTFNGSNRATLGEFNLGSNGNQSIIVNGPTVTLGTTTAASNRNSPSAANSYTLTSGTLNLTSTTSIANLKASGSTGNIAAPTFTIGGGILNNTSGSALNLGTINANFNSNPTITISGNFAFGTSISTNANNLNLGTGHITNSGNRSITINGTGTNLTLAGTMTNGVAGTQTTTVNGPGNHLTIGAYNLSNSTTGRTGAFSGSGNVNISGIVANSTGGTPTSNLTYSGTGTLTLGGQNTYSGNTTVTSGTLAVAPTGGIYTTGYTAAPTVTVSAGATLQLAAWQYGPTGGLRNLDIGAARLIINGGTISYTGGGEGQGSPNNGRLFTIGTGGATLHAAGTDTWFIDPNFSYDGTNGQIIPSGLTLTLSGSSDGRYNKFITGTGSLTKSGTGTWRLAGNNTYSGTTNIQSGTLIITGTTLGTSAINVGTNSSLGLVIGSPVTAANANVNLTNGTITVSGTPSTPSHTLLTALSIIGTPVLTTPISGYLLQVTDNQLQLVQTPSSTFDTWKTQITNGLDRRTDDADGDAFTNLQEFLFGTSPISPNGALVTITPNSGAILLRWQQRKTGTSYTLKQSPTLDSSSWSPVTSPIPALDSNQTDAQSGYDVHTISMPSVGEKQFFRIEASED